MKLTFVIATFLSLTFSQTYIVKDAFGNKGNGQNNTYSGTRNTWEGDKNTIKGINNQVKGNQNSVKGNSNNISGNINNVIGEQNKVSSERNTINGAGNVIVNPIQLTKTLNKITPLRSFNKLAQLQLSQYPKPQSDFESLKIQPAQQNILMAQKAQTSQSMDNNHQTQIKNSIKDKYLLSSQSSIVSNNSETKSIRKQQNPNIIANDNKKEFINTENKNKQTNTKLNKQSDVNNNNSQIRRLQNNSQNSQSTKTIVQEVDIQADNLRNDIKNTVRTNLNVAFKAFN